MYGSPAGTAETIAVKRIYEFNNKKYDLVSNLRSYLSISTREKSFNSVVLMKSL